MTDAAEATKPRPSRSVIWAGAVALVLVTRWRWAGAPVWCPSR
ncbi:hypothetical protein V1281_006818 [Nitrobacteraceae bacterium AZCC 2161]